MRGERGREPMSGLFENLGQEELSGTYERAILKKKKRKTRSEGLRQ